jgi:transglutaminase-like putative cysteine protease
MTGPPPTSPGTLLVPPAVGALTTWYAMHAWQGFTETPDTFLHPVLVLALVVAGTGAGLRWWRVPAVAVLLAELVAGGVVLSLIVTGSALPIGHAWHSLVDQLADGFRSANLYAAPVPDDVPSIAPLLILAGFACLLLVDLLACGLRRVPLAGLPLLTIYSVPVSMLGRSIPWWIFAVTAGGFLAMLFLQESEAVRRWGRPLAIDRETGDPIAFGAGGHAVRATATRIGGAATVLAIAVPAIVPSLNLHFFDFGPGPGGNGNISIENPTADLVRDLRQGSDVPLVEVTTAAPDPSYLRVVALTKFSAAAWTPGDRDVPTDQLAAGQMPPPQGVAADVPRTQVPWDVHVLPAFQSRWLPTTYPAGQVTAVGDWRYDAQTMDFMAVPKDLTAAGLHYSFSELDLSLTAQRLEESGTSVNKVAKVFTAVPSDVPPMVAKLAAQVTRDATTRFDKAVALQDWFRESGGFTYSLKTQPGSGYEALTSFLQTGPNGRTGYCEQFAASMALMARMLGIPSRVAIGFLHPTQTGPLTYVFSARDLHAWPELYFDGAGWVRFEPTPARRAAEVPSYTDLAANGNLPTSPAVPSSAAPSIRPSNRPTEEPSDAAAATGSDSGPSGPPWLALGGVLAGAVVAGGLLLLPRTLRTRRRNARLAAGDPELAWAEVRATALDLGVPWPEGRSPRATRDRLVDHFGAPLDEYTPDRPGHGAHLAPAAVAAMDRLVRELELSRYARHAPEGDAVRLRADAEAVREALEGGATRAARRGATWWPRSVLRRRGRSSRLAAARAAEARYSGAVVDEVG